MPSVVAYCWEELERQAKDTGAVKMQWIGQYQTFTDREWKHAE